MTVDDGVLRIQGERKREKEDKGKEYHRIERRYGTFLRSQLRAVALQNRPLRGLGDYRERVVKPTDPGSQSPARAMSEIHRAKDAGK